MGGCSHVDMKQQCVRHNTAARMLISAIIKGNNQVKYLVEYVDQVEGLKESTAGECQTLCRQSLTSKQP